MKETILDLSESYSCQQCGKTFKANSPLEIEVGILPVCSSICAFKKVYSFVQSCNLSNEQMIELVKIIKPKHKKEDLVQQNMVFLISKYFAQIGLSNIKVIKFLAQPLEPAQEPELTLAQKVGSNTPIVVFEPLSREPSLAQTKLKLEPTFRTKQKGDLNGFRQVSRN